MKIHITENVEKMIEGYSMFPIVYGKVDLGGLPDNSLTEIIAIDAIDSIPSNLLPQFMESIVKKMRMGCSFILGGLELGLLSRNITNGKLSSFNFNDIMSTKKSVHSSKDIVDLLKSHNINIDNVNIIGTNYEITASRPRNKN
jgi:hypothetical protein